jgi:hypothetical protein
MDHRLARNMQMAFMRRVEGAAEHADTQAVPVAKTGDGQTQGRICPLPRTM